MKREAGHAAVLTRCNFAAEAASRVETPPIARTTSGHTLRAMLNYLQNGAAQKSRDRARARARTLRVNCTRGEENDREKEREKKRLNRERHAA